MGHRPSSYSKQDRDVGEVGKFTRFFLRYLVSFNPRPGKPRTPASMALSFAQYILFSALLAVAYAQSNTSQTVWCSVVVTRNGDSTPLISNELTTLTPLGALQLNSAGALFRNRYIAVTDTSIDGSFPINGLSTYSIDNTQTFALSLLDEYVTASAQAFMQGLYPPLNTSYPDPGAPLVTPASLLADGSYVNNPLGTPSFP